MANVESKMIRNYATWDTPTQAQKDSIKNLIESDNIGIEVVGRFLGNDKKLSKYDKVFKYTQLSGQWEGYYSTK